MLGFIKTRFIELLRVCAIGSFSNLLVSNWKFISLKNQQWKVRPTIVNKYSNKTFFYSFTIGVNSAVKVMTLFMICMIEFVFQTK